MKLIPILIITICIHLSSIGQTSKMKIYFHDGTELIGFGKLITKNRVKFKESKNSKSFKYSFAKIDSVILTDKDTEKTFEELKIRGKESRVVLQKIIVGKLSLYKHTTYGQTTRFPGNGFGPGSSGMAGGNFFSIKNYYIMKEELNEVFHITSNQFLSKNFKKGASEYFKDCPLLVDKIKNREYKKRDIEEIIKFYNNKCE